MPNTFFLNVETFLKKLEAFGKWFES